MKSFFVSIFCELYLFSEWMDKMGLDSIWRHKRLAVNAVLTLLLTLNFLSVLDGWFDHLDDEAIYFLVGVFAFCVFFANTLLFREKYVSHEDVLSYRKGSGVRRVVVRLVLWAYLVITIIALVIA